MPSVVITMPLTGDLFEDGEVLAPPDIDDLMVLVGRPSERGVRVRMTTQGLNPEFSECTVLLEGPQEWIDRVESWSRIGTGRMRDEINLLEDVISGDDDGDPVISIDRSNPHRNPGNKTRKIARRDTKPTGRQRFPLVNMFPRRNS